MTAYANMTYAERVAAERQTARAIVHGLTLWQAFCYADSGTFRETEARQAWMHWLDTTCEGNARHPLANRAREMHDRLGATASDMNAAA